MASIKDVSREAGVSIATVSRVMNNTKAVNQETREKVEAAIRRLDYQTNAVARSLRVSQSHRIAVIITSIARNFFAEVIEGIEATASNSGYSIIISATNDDLEREQEQVEYFTSQWVDGIILASSVEDDIENADYIRRLASLKKKDVEIPVVTLEFSVASNQIDAVTVNHEQVAFDATKYLIENCHCKNIFHVSHKKGNRVGTMRIQGYLRALRTAGMPMDENYITYGDFTIRGGYKQMCRFLEKKLPVDGVYCANDQTAIGVMKACEKYGLRIPEDVAVVGTDDVYSSALLTPSLTTMNVPKYEMGCQAMSLLLDRINEGRKLVATNIVLEHTLIERQSTKKNAETDILDLD